MSKKDEEREEILENNIHYIYIQPTEYCRKKLKMNLIIDFMLGLNMYIGFKSGLNYNIEKLENFSIKIPVLQYDHKEFNVDEEKTINKKIKELKTFLSTFSKYETKMLLTMRNIMVILNYLGNEEFLGNLFRIYCPIINYTEIIKFKKINLKFPEIKLFTFIDGSIINLLIDPYLDGKYCLHVDLAQEFSEYDYQYNLLHFYEHLSCPWNMTDPGISKYNGGTTAYGECFVSAEYNSKQGLIHGLITFITEYIGKRNLDYWKKNKAKIELETKRTTSETINDRGFENFARADPDAFFTSYRTDVMTKWSQRPFVILIIAPENVDLPENKINKIISSVTPSEVKIEKPSFDYIPVRQIIYKRSRWIIKIDLQQIINNIYDNYGYSVGNFVCGIDCLMVFDTNIKITKYSVLNLLLYSIRYIQKSKLQDFLEKNVHHVLLPSNGFRYSMP